MLACNLQLVRPDSVLKVCVPFLLDHDFNRLRRTGFRSIDLFCPITLDKIQKKNEKYHIDKILSRNQCFNCNNIRMREHHSLSYSKNFHGRTVIKNRYLKVLLDGVGKTL